MLGRAIRLAILIGVLVPGSASAGIRATVVGNFDAPTYIAAPPGDTHRLFVVEQSGVIELIKDGGMPTAFLNVSSEVKFDGGEQGLLSMAFSPDYATSGRFYVYYTTKNCDGSGGCDEHVSEFTADPSRDTASAGSEHFLLTIPHPGQSNHNGGQLQFGPDGDLYISVGDGGGGNDTEQNAQRLNRLLGKVLRISPPRPAVIRSRRATRSAVVRSVRPDRAAVRIARRSGPTACATRGGSRLTARPATW